MVLDCPTEESLHTVSITEVLHAGMWMCVCNIYTPAFQCVCVLIYTSTCAQTCMHMHPHLKVLKRYEEIIASLLKICNRAFSIIIFISAIK